MAKPKNRSPWQVKLAGKETQRFRLESQAHKYLASLGYGDQSSYPRGALKQLETSFEAQVIRKDKHGVKVKRSGTFDTYAEAEKFITEQEAELKQMIETMGGFRVGYETITVEAALKKFHEEHYEGLASYKEVRYRIDHLTGWLGGNRKFRDLKKDDFLNLKMTLKAGKYSASSQRNYFTVLTSLYKHADEVWHFPVKKNLASGMKLPKPANYVQRDWVGDEEERLIKSIQQRSPWLLPIVEMSLEMSFRRGELVQGAKDKKTGEQSGGLCWENVDWSKNVLTLAREKNDRTKKTTESLGRSVPLTPKMREILKPLYDASSTKSGLIFSATTNSVSESFANCCKRADPPIKNLTFHSLRKIATKNLSKRLDNAMQLRRLTGHKNVEVLDKRYYNLQVEELAALLLRSTGTIKQRGVAALTSVLGAEGARSFLVEMRALEDLEDAFQ